MKDFLSSFMARHREIAGARAQEWSDAFEEIIKLIDEAFGHAAFRPEGRLNAAVYDAVMVGLAHARDGEGLPELDALRSAYGGLLVNKEFHAATSDRTSHQPNVQKRLQLARAAFRPR